MKRIGRISRTLAATVATAALVSASLVSAQEESIRVDDLRAQLAGGANKKSPMDIDAFEVAEGDVDAESHDLAAKEKELMAKLGSAASSAPAAPTGFVVQGRELASNPTSSAGMVKAKVDDALGAKAAPEKAEPAALTQNEKELASLKSTNTDLSRKLSQSQNKLSNSQRELKEARDRLMMAEAEIQRLSQIVERRGMVGLGKSRPSTPAVAPAPVARAAAAAAPKSADDLPVATVVVDKANLRTGPGMDNSSLMSVSRGTRLVIETRSGSWYRVFAPNGTRAWVTGDVLSFSSNVPTESGIGSALRVRGYDPGTEREVKGRVLN